jgi:hypothetical protein
VLLALRRLGECGCGCNRTASCSSRAVARSLHCWLQSAGVRPGWCEVLGVEPTSGKSQTCNP